MIKYHKTTLYSEKRVLCIHIQCRLYSINIFSVVYTEINVLVVKPAINSSPIKSSIALISLIQANVYSLLLITGQYYLDKLNVLYSQQRARAYSFFLFNFVLLTYLKSKKNVPITSYT